jgi:hypothetical protein
VRLGPCPRRLTVYSSFIAFDTGKPAPVTLEVEALRSKPVVNHKEPPAEEPRDDLPNVALTVHYMDADNKPGFRIAATNVSGVDYSELFVRYWYFRV